jgi:hypothetical protein
MNDRLSMRRFARLLWSVNSMVDRSLRASVISRTKTLTQSNSSDESEGSWMFVSMTVQSVRVLRPLSTPRCRARSSSFVLMASRVSGLRSLMLLCSADRLGDSSPGPMRQKARQPFESARQYASPR